MEYFSANGFLSGPRAEEAIFPDKTDYQIGRLDKSNVGEKQGSRMLHNSDRKSNPGREDKAANKQSLFGRMQN